MVAPPEVASCVFEHRNFELLIQVFISIAAGKLASAMAPRPRRQCRSGSLPQRFAGANKQRLTAHWGLREIRPRYYTGMAI
jgi:hypothetical protein